MPVVVSGCLYPTNGELIVLQRELFPRFRAGRLGLDLMPFRTTDRAEIIFNTPDNFRGMQQWRGLGKPSHSVGDRYNHFGNWCKLTPGYWGEWDELQEEFMTLAANPRSSCNEPYDLTEAIMDLQDRLMVRRLNRVEFNIWQSLIYGRYEALNSLGQVVHSATFNINFVSSTIPWSDADNSTPLGDMRCVKLLGRGTSADFGNCARYYMNEVTLNCLYRNRNPWDLGKHGQSACCDPMSLDKINESLRAQGLGSVVVYEGGWLDESDNFHTYIPDGKVVVIGCRPGNVDIGRYFLTRNAVDCAQRTGVGSGFWEFIFDNCGERPPRTIELHDGHNGGPAILYPRAIAVLETGCDYDSVCG